MPNRNLQGDYRYGYQGEYAEKDEETGLNAFQLRMYDSRIGRWISPDPYGEFHSPYLAMGNNPVSVTDPDGGCTTKGGRPCVFSVVSGTATDGGGNTWSKDFSSGGLSLETPQQLGSVFIADNRNFLQKFRGETSRASNEFFQPLRDFRNEFAEHANTVRGINREILQERIGGAYRAGAEYGLVGSGLYSGAALGSSKIRNFWTGGGPGGPAHLAAKAATKSGNSITVDMTWYGKIADKLDPYIAAKYPKLQSKMWDGVSYLFARGAQHGKVHTYFKSTMWVDDYSVWRRVEFKELSKRGIDFIPHIAK